MAVRNVRGAGLRRAARSRAGFIALACALYLAAGVSATWPAVQHARTHFLSGGATGHGEAAPGDYLQTLYHWWLVGHQLEHAHAPWLDPYSFRPEAAAQPNFAGWPFGFVFWPIGAIFGLVAGWNLTQLLVYVLAGLFTCAWLRELGLPRGPALAGGLAFSIAPYRVEQSVGHLLGPISIMLPLSLWAVERARRGSAWWFVLAGAAIASIPLSGQVHLALGAIPFFFLYAVVRAPRSWPYATACAAAAAGTGILVRQTVIVGSTEAGGRTLAEVRQYSADWSDLVSRHIDHANSEQFIYLGWATSVLALVGFVLLLRSHRFALAAVLGVGTVVPILLALGTHLPSYEVLWHALPPFRFPRVPERLLPIASLCIAGLVGFALGRSRTIAVSVVAIALLFVDLHVRLYGKSAADTSNAAYAAIPGAANGRLLELPVFDPGVHYGSAYLWYTTDAHRERPGGYSTTAPKAAKSTARRLERLNCGDWSDDTGELLRKLGVKWIALHRGLFVNNDAVPETTYFALRGLLRHGWSARETSGVIWMFAPGRGAATTAPSLTEPYRLRAYFCQGWYGSLSSPSGRYMSETHAPFWVYGAGRLRLSFAPSPLRRSFTVDGVSQRGPVLRLGRRDWHVITVEVPRLVPNGHRRVGLLLRGLLVG
jgi:hypothetical protein